MDTYEAHHPSPEQRTCELCDQQRSLSFHHLIPRTVHSNKWFKKNYDREQMNHSGLMLCRDCHRLVHRTFSAKELGRYYNSQQRLLDHETIAGHVSWVQRRHR